jgi:N-acetylmuramic acid 6-phosphate etherase
MVQAHRGDPRRSPARSKGRDDESAGGRAIDEGALGPADVLVGITASGQAPFVIGAMKRARQRGATVAALSCNKGSRTFEHADHAILVDVGPEIVSGSTRMKSGTAQKSY